VLIVSPLAPDGITRVYVIARLFLTAEFNVTLRDESTFNWFEPLAYVNCTDLLISVYTFKVFIPLSN